MSALLAVAALLSGSGAVQADTPVANAPACELHVWPAEGLTSVRQRASESNKTQGLVAELIRIQQEYLAEKADGRVAAAIVASENPLSPDRQRPALNAVPMAELFALPAYRMIVHRDPLDSRTIRTAKTRYTPSTAPCYAELVVVEAVYSREYARGRNLKTLLRFRAFDRGADAKLSFTTWTQTKLELFSLDPLRVDATSLEELASALRSNVVRFAEYLKARQSSAIPRGKE